MVELLVPKFRPDLSVRLARALMGLWIFHHLMGGGVTPSNSSPKCSEKRKSAFERSREIITKLVQSIFH